MAYDMKYVGKMESMEITNGKNTIDKKRSEKGKLIVIHYLMFFIKIIYTFPNILFTILLAALSDN